MISKFTAHRHTHKKTLPLITERIIRMSQACKYLASLLESFCTPKNRFQLCPTTRLFFFSFFAMFFRVLARRISGSHRGNEYVRSTSEFLSALAGCRTSVHACPRAAGALPELLACALFSKDLVLTRDASINIRGNMQ